MMVFNLLAWLTVGAVMGWLVHRLVRAGSRTALALNLGVGMAGALLAGWWLAPLIALPQDAMRILPSLDAIAVTSLGAVAVLLVVNVIPFLIRRRHLH